MVYPRSGFGSNNRDSATRSFAGHHVHIRACLRSESYPSNAVPSVRRTEVTPASDPPIARRHPERDR